jgi:hypothetical protein
MINELGIMLLVILGLLCIYCFYKLDKYFTNRKRETKLSHGIKIKKIEKKIVSNKPIYSLDLGSEITGSFFLGFGSIDSELKYYFYIDKDGGKKIISVNANDCVLIEGKGKPRIEEYEYNKNEDWTIDNTKEETDEEGTYKTSIFLYVPKNTIKRKFDGNLK